MPFMQQRWADYRVFWRQFREAYHSTGAVLPSGRALSRALARYVREPADGSADRADGDAAAVCNGDRVGRQILEVGPGTGAVTVQIVRDMGPADRLVLVERNEQFVAWLRGRLAEEPALRAAAERITLLQLPIEDLPEDEPFDVIVSGLPLNNFAAESVAQILAKLERLLAVDGMLSFFEYVAIRNVKMLASRADERARLRNIGRQFDALFRQQEVARDLVLANVPPAWVHHVRKERGAEDDN